MTISASIPAAVLSMAILRTFFRNVGILENNIVQTVASVGEGLAGGVIFTIPALFLLGATPSIPHIFTLALLGGILGVLFMIPMRRYIIVQEHGILPFPEGKAYAYLIDWSDYYAPKMLFELQKAGIHVESVHRAFSSQTQAGKVDFPAGTLMIPMGFQKMK